MVLLDSSQIQFPPRTEWMEELEELGVGEVGLEGRCNLS